MEHRKKITAWENEIEEIKEKERLMKLKNAARIKELNRLIENEKVEEERDINKLIADATRTVYGEVTEENVTRLVDLIKNNGHLLGSLNMDEGTADE